mgnify:CR=1 FL=1
MRYIKMVCDTEFCGTREEWYIKTNMTDEELEELGRELAYENAASYDYMVFGWGEDAESYAESEGISIEEAEGVMEDYYANASYYWEEITEEEKLQLEAEWEAEMETEVGE